MTHISTHVLDISQGRPAEDVPVRLERRTEGGTWQVLTSTRTDQDGRCGQLLPAGQLTAGEYRLTFDTEHYFSLQKVNGLYPRVEIAFHVRIEDDHLHIPLLLSPNGYTTYRGS